MGTLPWAKQKSKRNRAILCRRNAYTLFLWDLEARMSAGDTATTSAHHSRLVNTSRCLRSGGQDGTTPEAAAASSRHILSADEDGSICVWSWGGRGGGDQDFKALFMIR